MQNRVKIGVYKDKDRLFSMIITKRIPKVTPNTLYTVGLKC